MGDDRAGERVLGVGVDVHLDDAVGEGLADFLERRPGAAVEDEVHLGGGAVFVGDGFLAIAEDRRLELHRAGFVGAVDVAKGRGKHEPAEPVERLVDFQHVLGGRVELVGGHVGRVVAVLLAADDAGLDLEDDPEGGAFDEQVLGKREVFRQRELAGIQHVALEQRPLAGGKPLTRRVEQRPEERIHLVRLAVVGVQRDEHVVALRKPVDRLGQDDGTKRLVADRGAGGELPAAGGNLDDPVAVALRKRLERPVGGRQRGHVDRRIRVTTLLGGIKHGGILARSGNWHRDWR